MKKEKRNLIITEIVMVAIAIIWFIPIYYLIVTTLKGSQEATLNPLGLPRELRLDNYVNAWINMEFPRAFGNTFFITATAVLLIVIFGSMAGYAWQEPNLNGNQIIPSVSGRTDCSFPDEYRQLI